jgi:hypothetical protein
MKQKILTAVALLVLTLVTILVTTEPGRAKLVIAQVFEDPNPPNSSFSVETRNLNQGIPTYCALQPERNRTTPRLTTAVVPGQITLERFRRDSSNLKLSTGESLNPLRSSRTLSSYIPKEDIALAHPTNYGKRFLLDLYARPADREPIVVIHETVNSASSAINFFQTPHFSDSDQASYHALIKLDGGIVYVVPPEQRAFGAGDSIFRGENGSEAVKTHPDYPPSVNNFAYHVSLETPRDGRNNNNRHSGYTLAQYQSLAWLVAKTGVPNSRITTHKGVDRSGLRKDPRSFDSSTFLRLLDAFPRTNDIVIGCQPPLDNQ